MLNLIPKKKKSYLSYLTELVMIPPPKIEKAFKQVCYSFKIEVVRHGLKLICFYYFLLS